MSEESFRCPSRAARVIVLGARPEQLIQNIDYAPTFLEIAGLEIPGGARPFADVALQGQG